MKRMLCLFIFGLCSFSAAGAQSENLKAGWSSQIIEQLSSTCATRMFSAAKQGYYEKEKELGYQHPKPFPEAQMKQGITEMCGCLINAAAQNWTFADFSKNSGRDMSSLFAQVKQGKLCVPKGLLGKAIKQGQQ